MIEFRPFQDRAVKQARQMIAGGARRILINAPTGAGKTVIASGITKLAAERGKRVLFLAHRRELIDQCCAKLRDSGVLHYGVIMSGSRMHCRDAPVQVASVQTLVRRELPPADLIIIDECHRAIAPTYRTIINQYQNPVVVGLSATPERADGKGLDDLFDHLLVAETIPNLIADGYLIKPTCYVGDTPNLSRVRIRNGEYDEAELAAVMDKPELTGDILTNWLTHGGNARTVVFAVNVDHARHIAGEFAAAGIPSAFVHGGTPIAERDLINADWRRGTTLVVVNCDVYTEGFDLPQLEVCVLAAPTKSVGRYLQRVGRIMRACYEKTRSIVIDHSGCCLEFGGPHIHREWSLEGMAKRRKEVGEGSSILTACQACSLLYDAMPKWWLAETQGSLRDAFIKVAQTLLRGPKKHQGMATCPGCGTSACIVCGAVFEAKSSKQDIDGIAYENRVTCQACGTAYTDDVPHILTASEPAPLPQTTADLLAEMADEVPTNVVVTNEYKRLINEARDKGYKRGWAWYQLKKKYTDDVLRSCLPKHRAEWWRSSA